MIKLRKTIYSILFIIALLIVVCSLLSILSNTDNRYLKILDFPRIQFFIASFGCLIFLIFSTKKHQWLNRILIVSLLVSIIVQGSYLINYTNLVPKTVRTAKEGSFLPEDQISIVLVNVKMSNKKAQPLLDLLKIKMPDLLIAMEIDDWWEQQLEPIETHYPYTKETTNNDAYGMTLYSKLPLKEFAVNYLQNDKVPSFESIVQLKNGKNIHLYSVHPVPPIHFKDLPDNEGQREAEMLILGDRLKDDKLPTIVAGDINDVSWGATDKLIGAENLLYDVRVGRGFYNSYNTNNIFMRWPLDHFFVSEEFRLITLERLPNVGSDHYPMYLKLAL